MYYTKRVAVLVIFKLLKYKPFENMDEDANNVSAHKWFINLIWSCILIKMNEEGNDAWKMKITNYELFQTDFTESILCDQSMMFMVEE